MRLFLAAVALAGLVGVASHHGTAVGPQGSVAAVGSKTFDGVTARPVVSRPAALSKQGAIPAW